MPDARPAALVDEVTDEDHSRGPADAAVVLVEYGDYECPHCVATFGRIESLMEAHAGRLRFVFRHFPLTTVHPRAGVAAQVAEAAAAQGRFWDMHALLYRRPGGLEVDDLDRLALRLGLEIYRFNADVSTQRWSSRVERDVRSGRRSGVRGTPTFFLNGLGLATAELDDRVRAAVSAV
jgi:protein-disulfide isomerase